METSRRHSREKKLLQNEFLAKEYQITTDSGGSSVSQNKLLQLILGYIYILKHLHSNFIG